MVLLQSLDVVEVLRCVARDSGGNARGFATAYNWQGATTRRGHGTDRSVIPSSHQAKRAQSTTFFNCFIYPSSTIQLEVIVYVSERPKERSEFLLYPI